MSIDVAASVALSIGDVEKVGNSVVDRLSHKPKPIYLRRSASFNISSPMAMGAGGGFINQNGGVTLDIGACPAGRLWQIRVATLFGTDDHTVVSAVTMSMYVADPLNPGLHGLLVTGLAVPSTTFFPDTCLWAHPAENIILVSSGTVTQQIGVNVTIEEWREHEVTQNSGR
jgi:hypothetical protein